VKNLSKAGGNGTNADVGVDGDGDAVYTWQGHDGSTFRAQGRARSAAGTLSAIQTLSPAGETIFIDPPHVAVDASGDAVFTWLNFTLGQIQARTRTATGTLGSVETLSAAGQSADEHQVAIGGDGNAAVSWRRSDGTHFRVQGADGP
ncbi:MAG: hypothetical protein ACRDKX_05020, partial [Solirubrobacterales bacterium]